jgi:predicted esterase
VGETTATAMRISRMRRTVVMVSVLVVTGLALAAVPPVQSPVGEMVEGIACASDPTQTYTLYLPRSFDTAKRWPVLLIFDPRGRSVLAAELFREAADTYGWILVSSDNTRSDGPMEPNVVALNALWPEVHTRLPVQSERVYAAGFSGGAAVAYVLSRGTHEVAGIIACGGRYLPDVLEGNDVPVFSIAGNTDFNYHEAHQLNDFLAEQGNPHRLVIFEGPHAWMPPALASEAVAWFELLAMNRGLRPVDKELIASLWTGDLASAQMLESEGQLITAARWFREMTSTYEGLCDVSAAERAAEGLERSAEFKRQTKELKRWNAYENDYLETMNRQFYLLRNAEILPPTALIARDLRIDELKRRALEPGVEGITAQRVVNGLSSGLNFYLARDFTAEERYDRLVVCLELGLQLTEDNAVGWYNLACARARVGREEAAVAALAKALELGFDRDELLAADPDLDSLRDRDDFKALLAARASTH